MKLKKIFIKLMDAVMLDCKEATLLISKKLDGNLSLREKIQLKMHLANCHFCNTFKLQSAKIDEVLKMNPDDLHQKCTHLDKMNDEKKKEITVKITENIDNQDDKYLL